jgi:hypothetical protein
MPGSPTARIGTGIVGQWSVNDMPKFDIEYQAFRREQLHRIRNMDPDVLVAELDINTDTLMNVLWEEIEQHIEDNYNDDQENDDDEG